MNDSALNPEPASPLAAELSAVMDGEANGEAVERVSRAWRQDGRTRADWQAYHLIGDVLRTPDLAGDPAAQARLLHRVQDRLASEPAWMLPSSAYADAPDAPDADAALTARHGRRPSWLRRATAPVGIAAGIALVAGLTWLRPGTGDDATLARNGTPPAAVAVAGAGAAPGVAMPVVTSGPVPTQAGAPSLAATAQFEPYLSAHRLVPATAAFGVAPGLLRSVARDSRQP